MDQDKPGPSQKDLELFQKMSEVTATTREQAIGEQAESDRFSATEKRRKLLEKLAKGIQAA